MLVLSRKENECLVIDGRIVVHVVRLAGGKVKLGIEAPPEVTIQREEIVGRPSTHKVCRGVPSNQTVSAAAAPGIVPSLS